MSETIRTADSCIVAIDFANGKDNTVLIVGKKKPNMDIDIVNAIQGEDAIRLWNELITQKKRDDSSNIDIPVGSGGGGYERGASYNSQYKPGIGGGGLNETK